MPVALMSRFSYPKVPGDGFWSIVDVAGPASYVPITGGTPPSGGQQITAADFGLQSIDWVGSMGDSTGEFSVIVFPAHFAAGSALNAVLLAWHATTAGEAEAAPGANLSQETVRLLAVGR